MLECVLLLLQVWETRVRAPRVPMGGHSRVYGHQPAVAPLVPCLLRLQNIPAHNASSTETTDGMIQDSNLATESYLRYNELPASDSSMIDLKRCAVTIMCHLDRLALPYNPPLSFRNLSETGTWQEIMAMGSLGWGTPGTFGPQSCDILGELGVKSICCAEKLLLILTHAGKAYTLYYNSEAQVLQILKF